MFLVYLTETFDTKGSLAVPSDGAKKFSKLKIFFEIRGRHNSTRKQMCAQQSPHGRC